MRRRATAVRQRKPDRPSNFSGPPRIPGVHIGHIGGQAAAIEQIRAYWRERGAVFMHHDLEYEQHTRFEEVLCRSHILFHARSGVSARLSLSLERYCDRAEKPLILLEENSLWALTKALAEGLPLP